MVRFHETNLGRQHYERDFPALVRELREFNGSLHQLLSQQDHIMEVAKRALVANLPKDQLPTQVLRFTYTLRGQEECTVYLESLEEFISLIGEKENKQFSHELEFSKWLLAEDALVYESIVYYAP